MCMFFSAFELLFFRLYDLIVESCASRGECLLAAMIDVFLRNVTSFVRRFALSR